MHPALMIAVMQERDREIARRTKHAYRQPARKPRGSRRHTVAPSHVGGRGRVSTALARSLALFG